MWVPLERQEDLVALAISQNSHSRPLENPHNAKHDGGRGRTRTGTPLSQKQILSLLCLPVSPRSLRMTLSLVAPFGSSLIAHDEIKAK